LCVKSFRLFIAVCRESVYIEGLWLYVQKKSYVFSNKID